MPDDNALLDAYRSTRWVGSTPDGRSFEFTLDGSLDICRFFDVRTVSIVTASNPGSVQLDEKDNASRNHRLEERLRRDGYDFVSCDGVASGPTEWSEASYAVLDITRPQATTLGTDFGQNAVVWAERGTAPGLLITKNFAGHRVGKLISPDGDKP